MDKQTYLRRGLVVLAIVTVIWGVWYILADFPSSQQIDLKMTAWEITPEGTVLEALTLSTFGKITHYREKNTELDAEISAPSSYRYRFTKYNQQPYCQIADFYEKLDAFVSASFIYDTEKNSSSFAYFALDTENHCMILYFEERDIYLVASADPEATPLSILAHFEWFTLHY